MNKITVDNVLTVLDSLYEQCQKGLGPVSKPIDEFANDYLSKEPDVQKAAKDMIDKQVAKCATSGFVTGFGGLITLPITIPANISSVLYVQMRMIACCAYMAGYDLKSDQVQTLVYTCLAGVSLAGIGKNFSIRLGNKVAEKAIQKIPGKVLTEINKKVGFRLITKAGEKGLINIGKMIPVVGAGINAVFDFAETKVIANRAYKEFILGDFTPDDDEELIDVDTVIEYEK